MWPFELFVVCLFGCLLFEYSSVGLLYVAAQFSSIETISNAIPEHNQASKDPDTFMNNTTSNYLRSSRTKPNIN